jgi:hypothetical protein
MMRKHSQSVSAGLSRAAAGGSAFSAGAPADRRAPQPVVSGRHSAMIRAGCRGDFSPAGSQLFTMMFFYSSITILLHSRSCSH